DICAIIQAAVPAAIVVPSYGATKVIVVAVAEAISYHRPSPVLAAPVLVILRYLPAIEASPPALIVTSVAPLAMAVTVDVVTSGIVKSTTSFLPRIVTVLPVVAGVGAIKILFPT